MVPPSSGKVCLVAARNLDKAGNEVPAIASTSVLRCSDKPRPYRLAVLYDRQSMFPRRTRLI
jgi:hypothetical protein